MYNKCEMIMKYNKYERNTRQIMCKIDRFIQNMIICMWYLYKNIHFERNSEYYEKTIYL